jgi:hypothetical protein
VDIDDDDDVGGGGGKEGAPEVATRGRELFPVTCGAIAGQLPHDQGKPAPAASEAALLLEEYERVDKATAETATGVGAVTGGTAFAPVDQLERSQDGR